MMNLITSHGARATVKTWKTWRSTITWSPPVRKKGAQWEPTEAPRFHHSVYLSRLRTLDRSDDRAYRRHLHLLALCCSGPRFLSSSLHLSHFFHALCHTPSPSLVSLSLSHSLAVFFALLFLLIFPHCWQTSAPTAKYYDGSSRRPAWRLSPALPRAPYCTFQEQRDPCLNSGKNKRQLMRPHYVNALCSLELWPQPKMTWANYGQ